jgi:AAA domain-containing protein
MAISLKDLKSVKTALPPRVLIYGPEKMGKTTLANEWPDAVFLQTEDGENTAEIKSFGLISEYADVISIIDSLYNEPHKHQTLVVDTIDRLGPILTAECCRENDWKDIETPGYGKGYTALDLYWRNVLEGFDALRRDREMSVILISHSEITTFNDPRTASYSRYEPSLHKRVQALVCANVDVILFLNQEAVIKEEKKGFGASRAIGDGGIQRYMYLEGRPAMNAGNRYSMPPKIPYMKGQGYEMLAPYFPHVNGGNPPVAAQTQATVIQDKEKKPSKTANLKKIETKAA